MRSLEPAAVGRPVSGAGHGGISLLSGWLPPTVQLVTGVVAVVCLATLIPRTPRRWVLTLVVAAGVLGGLAAAAARWSLGDEGLAADPAPTGMWLWIGAAGAGLAVVGASCRWAGWRHRALSVLAAGLALVCAGLAANQWVGYFPSVAEAWDQLSAAPMPDQVDPGQLGVLSGTPMSSGKLEAVTVPDDVSHFAHRTEYVYLPPAWFTGDRASLPVVLMIGGEFSTPTDWIRTGDAVTTADRYALTHHGLAPVLVFADSTGSFRNDTECVDGPRGNAAEHLTRELRPYVISHFDTASSPARWGVAGWSTGGTCAVDLAVTHPELFGTFEDIQGDLSPNAGTVAQTVHRLYGGDAGAWAAFDPTTVLARHAPYPDSAGRFDNSPADSAARPRPRRATTSPADPLAGFGGRRDPAPAGPQGQQAREAATLCAEASAKGVTCSLHTLPGRHTWQFARAAFTDALPWLTTRLGAPPGAPPPGAPTVPTRCATARPTAPGLRPATSPRPGPACTSRPSP